MSEKIKPLLSDEEIEEMFRVKDGKPDGFARGLGAINVAIFVRNVYEDKIEEKDAALKAAAIILIRRWHSPQWKWDDHTGELIKRLADAAGIDTSEL